MRERKKLELIARLAEAAGAGDLKATFFLGVMKKEEGDLEEGVKWFKRAADAGHVDSMYELALIAEDK